MNASLRRASALIVLVSVSVAAGFGVATWRSNRMLSHESPAPEGEVKTAGEGRSVLYWYDPMFPQQKFDKPGKSPFMNMMLVPKYAADAPATGVKIDSDVRQNLAMRLATVSREKMVMDIEAVAVVGFDERNVAIVQVRSNAFVQRVYGLAPADLVASGAALADLMFPEWAGAQYEFLALLNAGELSLAQAARERMRLLGMPEALLERVERNRQPITTITLTAPIAGVIQELGVREGMTLSAGATIARINAIGAVWLEAAVPEAQAAMVRIGAPVQARFAAYPGEVFNGRVAVLLPEANREARTLRVRMEFANPGLRLRPGMFAQASIAAATEEALVVPSEAVIRTGKRAVVFVAGAKGELSPVEVELGAEVGNKLVVRKGVTEGQQVVSSGQFLIDSEASVRGVVARMQSSASLHEGSGTIEEMGKDEVTLAHGPIASLRWGPMTMAFKLSRPELTAPFKPKDSVRFRFKQVGDDYVIEHIEQSGIAK